MARYPLQRVTADMALSDVPVAIHPRVVLSPRIIEVDSLDFLRSHLPIQRLDRRFESLSGANVVTGGEGVSGIEANTQGQSGTSLHDFSQVLKPMADAFALAGGIFQKNPNRPQIKSVRRSLQTLRARLNPLSLT